MVERLESRTPSERRRGTLERTTNVSGSALPPWNLVWATLWIVVSEFGRNELLLKSYWTRHFGSLELTFETRPANGVLWVVWSLALAYLILRLGTRFSRVETVFLAWLAAFGMMWLTLFNLQVLPMGLLVFALPLSLLEIWIAALILDRGSRNPSAS